MSIFDGILYGIIQGIAEFLPISSSGHLALINAMFGGEGSNFTFEILLHMATFFAVCIMYYKDVWTVIKSIFSLLKKLFTGRIKEGLDSGEKLFLMLCITTLPLVFIALVDQVINFEDALRNYLWVIGMLLIINGVILFVGDRMGKGTLTVEEFTYKNTVFVGLMQMFSVLPGISRSGTSITGGVAFGLKREEAVRFSFLMSLPAVFGATVLELPEFFRGGIDSAETVPVIVGALTALIVGMGAIKLLQIIAKKDKFGFFAMYCILVGITAIVFDILR